jgi:hypothetical protein
MMVPDTHKRLITLVSSMPKGNVFTSAELAKKLNQETRGIGRRLMATDMVEKVKARQGGVWKRI